jgi:uncharacterized alkaline shock family protein YloU
MTRPAQPDPPRLECGRELLVLVEQVSDGLPPAEPEHQARCPFCQEALARLQSAFDALHELAGRTVAAPRGLSTRVLEQLRRERHSVVIAASPAGRDTVSEVIVTQIARRALLAVDAVRDVSVVSHATQDGRVDLDVHVVAALGPALPDLAAELRDQVLAHVWALAGARVGRVDVTVDDVV